MIRILNGRGRSINKQCRTCWRVQIRSEGMNTRPQKAVQTHCIRPGRPIYSPPHSFPFLPRSLPQMEHHPSTPAKPVTDIPLEKVPPLYGGRRASLGLNIIVVGAGIGGLAAAHTLAHAGHRVRCSNPRASWATWAQGSKSRPTRRDSCSAGASAPPCALTPSSRPESPFGAMTRACAWATPAGARA